MKTKYFTSILLIILAISWQSCEDFLDIRPQESMDADEALTTPQNVKATLIGAYLEMRSRWTFGSQFNEYAELMATTGHLQHVGSHRQPQEMVEKNIAVNNSYIESSWIIAYSLINTINNVIHAIDILDEQDRDRVLGEALFLRGMVYFDLTRLWGLPYVAGHANDQPGVPLIILPTLGAPDAVPVARATVHDCYLQVITDLTTARDLLPAANGVFANSYAASALLSRVYLQMSDFAKAAEEANRVIESGAFQLNATPMDAFNNSQMTGEDIFTLQNSLTSHTIWLPERYGSLNGLGRGDYQFSPDFLQQFHEDDLRGHLQEDTQTGYTLENIHSMYYIGVGAIRNGGINTAKWGNYYTAIPLIRLAEMYLTRAEANFELMAGGSSPVGPASPKDDINTLRQRANAPLYQDPPGRDQIRLERYLELCWEGHRLHDLKRWQMDIGNFPFNAGNLILPIPVREMETNPLLKQNPFYQ
ncbi:MAG: RagB/SusD family nutrient uptake outer membrane protein [Bacteroidia bacterium]|nr:MAG: RagB/SusD family nutrient uptake outer membrane protein [Bacteroidia bacterium]